MSRMAVSTKTDFKCKFLRLSKRMPYAVFSNIESAFKEHDVITTSQGVRVDGRLEWSTKKDNPDSIKFSTARDSFRGVLYMESAKTYFITPWYLINNCSKFGYNIDSTTGRVAIGFVGQKGIHPFSSYSLGSYCILGHNYAHMLIYSYKTESLHLYPYVKNGGTGYVELEDGTELLFPLTLL